MTVGVIALQRVSHVAGTNCLEVLQRPGGRTGSAQQPARRIPAGVAAILGAGLDDRRGAHPVAEPPLCGGRRNHPVADAILVQGRKRQMAKKADRGGTARALRQSPVVCGASQASKGPRCLRMSETEPASSDAANCGAGQLRGAGSEIWLLRKMEGGVHHVFRR
ncbi:hypothetical protein PF003_g4272 [Phytophthora fragariae]|nr:hypothetical protein PF003_g4272 [Phytophthora fragariae]